MNTGMKWNGNELWKKANKYHLMPCYYLLLLINCFLSLFGFMEKPFHISQKSITKGARLQLSIEWKLRIILPIEKIVRFKHQTPYTFTLCTEAHPYLWVTHTAYPILLLLDSIHFFFFLLAIFMLVLFCCRVPQKLGNIA